MANTDVLSSLCPCPTQEGAFALVCKSSHYPGEVVATRRGSPLLVGIRSNHHVITNNIPVYVSSHNSKLKSNFRLHVWKMFVHDSKKIHKIC